MATGADNTTVPPWLELEELDRNLFRGTNELDYRGLALFGGQVAAQALRAAAGTVEEDRLPHSLHGYFLRPGSKDRPVILRVDIDRDGRSFSARRVAATQNGEVIFEMSASFCLAEEAAEFEVPVREPAPPPPESVSARRSPLFDIRPLPALDAEDTPTESPSRLWGRYDGRLPDSPIVHACLLAYLSDHGTGFSALDIPGLPIGGASIDHALWFHNAVRADEWLLFDMWPLKAGGGRGLYTGAVHDTSGRLAAMFTQEMRLRHR